MLTHPYSVVLTLLNVDFDNTFACDLGKTRSFVKIVQEVATYIRQRNCRSGSKPELKILKYLQKPHVSLQGNQVKKQVLCWELSALEIFSSNIKLGLRKRRCNTEGVISPSRNPNCRQVYWLVFQRRKQFSANEKLLNRFSMIVQSLRYNVKNWLSFLTCFIFIAIVTSSSSPSMPLAALLSLLSLQLWF